MNSPLSHKTRSRVRKSLAASLVALVATAPWASAAVLWSTTFTEPPYTVGETVVGKQGWVLTNSTTGDAQDASLVSHANAANGTALQIRSSATSGSIRRTWISNTFEKVAGNQVAVTLSAAYQWTGSSVNGVGISFTEDDSNSPVILNFTATEGLSFNGTYADLASNVILPVAQMVQNQFYTFKFVFDFEEHTFSLTVEGAATPFSVEGVGFRNGKAQTMTGIETLKFNNNRGDYIQYYVDSVSVTAVPEASSLAMLGVGGIFLLGGVLRHQRRHGCQQG